MGDAFHFGYNFNYFVVDDHVCIKTTCTQFGKTSLLIGYGIENVYNMIETCIILMRPIKQDTKRKERSMGTNLEGPSYSFILL